MAWKWEPDNPTYPQPYMPIPPTTDPLEAIKKQRKWLKKLEAELKPKDNKDEKKKRVFSTIETFMLSCMIAFTVGPAIGLIYFMVISAILKNLH